MITVVITESGKTKGYLIDDIYVRKDLLKYFTPVRSFRGVKVVGKSFGEDIKIRNKHYKSVKKYLNIDSYNKIIRAFTISGIELNSVLFIPCKPTDYEFNDMSELWKIVYDLKCRNLYYYKIVDIKSNCIAYLMSYNDLYKSSSFYINMLEVIDKGKGYGTLVVNTLKSFDKSISGLSMITSKSFWKKLGASFIDSMHFSL